MKPRRLTTDMNTQQLIVSIAIGAADCALYAAYRMLSMLLTSLTRDLRAVPLSGAEMRRVAGTAGVRTDGPSCPDPVSALGAFRHDSVLVSAR